MLRRVTEPQKGKNMKYSEFRRWLKKQGCTFETHDGGSGHITVIH
jgi:hypothetical protein